MYGLHIGNMVTPSIREGEIGRKLNRFSKERESAQASYMWEAHLMFDLCREQPGRHCPPTVSTFSAVSTDRFPAFYKSLGVMTFEGCMKLNISLMCIIAGTMTISYDAEKLFFILTASI